MIKVKTFSTPIQILHTARQLAHLDQEVNDFLAQGGVTRLVSVSDVTTTGDGGVTMGLIRVVAYQGKT